MNSAFIGTSLKEKLDQKGITTLVLAGLITDHCVSTTARMAGNYGYHTYLVADGCATFDRTGFHGNQYKAEDIHEVELASLHGEFATVVESGFLLDQLKS